MDIFRGRMRLKIIELILNHPLNRNRRSVAFFLYLRDGFTTSDLVKQRGAFEFSPFVYDLFERRLIPILTGTKKTENILFYDGFGHGSYYKSAALLQLLPDKLKMIKRNFNDRQSLTIGLVP